MIKVSRIAAVAFGILLIGGCLSLVITHASLKCSATYDGETIDCLSILESDSSFDCPGPLTATGEYDSINLEVICPWSQATSGIYYFAAVLSLMIFVLYLLNKETNNWVYGFLFFCYVVFVIDWSFMLFELIQTSDVYFEKSEGNSTISKVPFILTGCLCFAAGNYTVVLIREARKAAGVPNRLRCLP